MTLKKILKTSKSHKFIYKTQLLTISLLILSAFVSYQNLAFYLKFDFNLILSLLLVPFVLYVKHPGNYSLRYGFISLLFLCLYPVLKLQSFYFFGFSFFLLFIVESQLGKLNNLPLFFLILLSPFTIFAIEVFGFPIRLWLTEASTQIISFVNNDISSSGNLIFFNGNKFSVDPECMGLKMVITGYLITLVIIAFFEKKNKQELGFFMVITIFLATSILIIISNLFRIIGIIFAKAPPETFLHEMTGIICLVAYVIVPVYFLCKLLCKYFAKPVKTKKPNKKRMYSYFLIAIPLILLGYLNFNRENYRNMPDFSAKETPELEGFKCSNIKHGVQKFSNDSVLIYIKPIPSFYSADHTPMICWKGSGYKLQNQKKIEVEEIGIYYAELTQEKNDTLYTAWWYSNGKHLTLNQFDWRWRLINGEKDFNLINVTSNHQTILKTEIKNLLKVQPNQIVF